MKKWIPLLAFLLAGLSHQSIATHLVGAEISYKPTSTTGVIEVRLVVFRNCDGGTDLCLSTCGAACTQSLSVMGADPAYVTQNYGSFTVSLVNVRDVKDNQSAGIKNTCKNMNCAAAGTFTPGIERYEFVGFLNIGLTSGIPAAACNVRIEWNVAGGRNPQIATGSASQNFYVNAIINRCQFNVVPNASPTYTYDPIAIQCAGQSVLYNLGAAYDPDGDSLSYAFAPALQAYNSSVTYTPPWAYDKPMPWSGGEAAPFPAGIHCDPVTGVLGYTPGNVSSYNFYGVICIEVKQWKIISGIPIVVGKTYRDFQNIILANCVPNTNPALLTYPSNAANPNAPKTDWVFPSGQQSCFTMVARDSDAVSPSVYDTAVIDTSNVIGNLGGSITRLSAPGAPKDSLFFCWTPTQAQEKSQPYLLSFRVNDNRKPIAGKMHYVFKIKVAPMVQIAAGSIIDMNKGCNVWDFSYNLLPGSDPIVQTKWRIYKLDAANTGSLIFSQTLPGKFDLLNQFIEDSGRYVIELGITPGVAERFYYDTIHVSRSAIGVQGTDTIVCPLTQTTLQCKINNAIGKPNYQWKDGVSLFSTQAITALSGKTSRSLLVSVTDSIGCIAKDSVYLNVFPVPVLAGTVNNANQCLSVNHYVFTNSSTNLSDTNFSFVWNVEGTRKSGNILHEVFSSPGDKSVRLYVTTQKGCADSIDVNVTVTPNPVALLTVNDSSQCLKGNSFIFTNSSSGQQVSSFSIDGSAPVNSQSITRSFTSIGFKQVRLVVSALANLNCRDTLNKQVEVLNTPSVAFTISDTAICKNESLVFTSTGVNTMPVQLRWVFADNMIDTMVSVTRKFKTSGLQQVYLKVTANTGCADSIVKNVLVYSDPLAPVISGPTSGFPNTIATYSVASNPNLSYKWQIENGRFISTQLDTQTVNVAWDSTAAFGRLYLHTLNSWGCGSDTTRYNVSIIGGVGIADMNATFQNLSVFPNPTTDAVTISFNSMQAQRIRVTLYNIVGTEVKTISYAAPKGMVNEQLNLHDLQKGIYFMRIEGESGSQTLKILLK